MATISCPRTKKPEDVADAVLRRAEVAKVARHLYGYLALAAFKTKHGLENLSFDTIEPLFGEQLHRRRPTISPEIRSNSSSSISSGPPCPSSSNNQHHTPVIGHLEMSLFGGVVGSSSESSGRSSLDSAGAEPMNPRGRLRAPLAGHNSFTSPVQEACSSGKPRRQQHFTTSDGPDVSFVRTRCLGNGQLTSSHSTAPDADGDDVLFARAFNVHPSPPRTPPRTRRSSPISRPNETLLTAGRGRHKLPLYLVSSTPAVDQGHEALESESASQGEEESWLQPSIQNTLKGDDLFPVSPSRSIDLADFIKFTPSPERKASGNSF